MPIATPQGTLDFKSVDKVTFVGASSNTVIDTTTGSLGVGVGVGGPTSNLHVVGNTRLEGDINMLHTANTASIKLNSNVVTEFPRSKKLIKYPRVALTSASYNAYESGYKVTRSNASNSSYQEWEAFDGMPGDGVGWYSGGSAGTEYNGTGGIYNGNTRLATETELGEWLGLELPESIKLQYLRLVSQSYSPVTNTIDDFILYAKKQSGDTWTSLGLFTGKAPAQTSPSGVIVNIDANDYYKFFAIVARKSAISSLGVSIRELEYYGVPEYDPDADGTDVTIKSKANVPNTDWLEVYYDAKDLGNGIITAVDDLTPNGTNDGTATGDLTVSDGVFTFDGTNDSISTTSTATLSFHTASMWIKFEQFSSWVAVYAIRPASLDRNNAFLYANADGRFRLEALGNTGPYKDFDYTFEPGKWVHLTVLFDGTGLRDSKLYIDGIELSPNGTVRSDTDDITITGTTTVYIGSEPGYYFTGSFANFRLFNRKLTIDEIYQLYAYQKEYFGYGDLSMTLKAGRLGIGTSEPRAALDVRGDVRFSNVPHIYATDDGGFDGANDAYINFDRVESSYGIALVGTNGTFKITEQAGAGVYYVDGSVSFHQSNGTEVRNLELIIHLNGVSHHSNNRNYGLTAMKHVGSSTYSDLGVTALVKCNVGDEIRLYGKSRSSSINVHTPNNKMVIFKVQST